MRFLCVVIAGLLLISGGFLRPAFAQDAVTVRSGAHDDYWRLVFEWPEKPQYSLSKENGRVLVRFAKAGTADTKDVDTSGTIKKVETLSAANEPLQMAVTIPDGSRFRDFTVNNKVILDVYNPDKTAAAERPSAPVPEKSAEENKPKEDAPDTASLKLVPDKGGDFSMTHAPSAPAAPVTTVDSTKVEAPATADHSITMTSTTGFGVAAFERTGYLWIIVDNTEAGVMPKVNGPHPEQFGDFTKIAVPGGAAYRVEMPDGVHAYGEGGGLGWRIVLTQKPRNVKGEDVKRADRSLVWPMSLMRKQISFTDPIVGDKIVAITAPHSDQFAGPAKDFVELRQLDSVIGLVFVPKADDVTATIAPDSVTVTKMGGLAVSTAAVAPVKTPEAEKKPDAKPDEQQKDAQPANDNAKAEADAKNEDAPADETKTEDAADDTTEAAPAEEAKPSISDLSKVASDKPTGNNIYNFPHWEMGGINALQGNMHAIMLENAGKKDEEMTEGIITMAKLNIANNRAPEALGLLRIAEQFVPDLEENSEFLALRGAASALAGKYDVAFSDFTDVPLQKYDDIKYWKAFTLAGLEDWTQAVQTMPENFQPIADYPAAIRTPLMLTFAEIALRGGKVPLAINILSMLKPDVDKMILPYKSWWNYLNGEAARQKGNAKLAEAYWTPLVKNGKDNLYRAKAGLSLTKLQLDQKEIQPAEAIDRLEGLRYAWRGDELETLVNYRLGQMYVENKDYLKGLTILRNAQSLANSRELQQSISDYMAKTFREIFTNDKLKELSPLQAISLYEEFKDLAPPGDEGNAFVEKLSERLVDADLLGRASALLDYQVNNRLQGDKKVDTAIRLAAIRLLDGNPDGALRALEIAQSTLDKAGTPAPKPEAQADETAQPDKPLTSDPEKQRQIDLLKARALSMNKKTDEAMAILEKMRLDPDVNALRADIAWSAGKWEEAAFALNDLLVAEDISPKKPLTPYQTDLVLNRGIALNLSGNRVALANLRERYNAQMMATPKGSLFEIVTRPRRPDMIGSREAIQSMISELSLFKGFLDSYSTVNGGKKQAPPNGNNSAPAAAGASNPAASTAPAAEATTPAAEAPAQEKAPVSEPVPPKDGAAGQ